MSATLTEEDVAWFVTGRQDRAAPDRAWADLLGSMLVLSLGRPWHEETPELSGAAVTHEGGETRVAARAGSLTVLMRTRVQLDRRYLDLEWRNDGEATIEDLVVGIRVPGAPHARITIPQVIYHDNPSADPDRPVPHVGRGGFVTELHRLPIPAVCLQADDGTTVTLVTVPDPDPAPDGRVRYGSMGAIGGPHPCALALSGVTLFDGVPDVTYVHKARTAPTTAGYRSLAPGDSIRQSFVICSGWAPPGQGFRELVRVGRELFDGGRVALPGPLEDRRHIDLRVAAMDARAFVDGDVVGYLKFPAWGEPRKRPGRAAVDFLYGWTGQCLRLAWCDARVGLDRGEDDRVARARAACEFYLRGSGTGVPGLRHNQYVHDDRSWHGQRLGGRELISARAHGETMCDLADLITLLRRHDLPVPGRWSTAVQEAAELIGSTTLPSGLVPIGWDERGRPADDLVCAAGIPAAHAVAKASAVCGDTRLLRDAVEMGEAYHQQYGVTFDVPFARSTLDAACEDKEAGQAYLELLMTLYDLTGAEEYLRRARVVADWLLTWVYHWNPAHDDGTPLRERGFSAVGWPGVSVQNHHLDAFFPSFDMWRLGVLTGDRGLQSWARTIISTMGQGVCTAPGEWGFDVVGEQGEAFFVTNWQDRGHSNTWNPSWVIAHPLWQLLRFAAASEEVPGA